MVVLAAPAPALALDAQIKKDEYRMGNSKVFFKAGVLASLEEKRDDKVTQRVGRAGRLGGGGARGQGRGRGSAPVVVSPTLTSGRVVCSRRRVCVRARGRPTVDRDAAVGLPSRGAGLPVAQAVPPRARQGGGHSVHPEECQGLH